MFLKISIIFIILISFESEAKFLKEKEIKDFCLDSYLNNPFLLDFYKGKNNLSNDETFLSEIDSYCSCEDKVLKKDIEEKKKDWIAYAFKDKRKMLNKRDECAIEYFSKENLALHYRSRFFQWFSPQIFEKIKEYNLKGIERFVSHNSYSNYMNCFHDEVSKKCSKIQSLSLTYVCIKENFSIDNYYKNLNKCQIFLYEKDNLDQIFERGDDNFI